MRRQNLLHPRRSGLLLRPLPTYRTETAGTMAFHIHTADGGAFVFIRADGPANSSEWEDLHQSQFFPDDGTQRLLLFDLRGRDTLPTKEMADRAALALEELTPRISAVALVARMGAQYGCARMVDSVAMIRGVPVRTFIDADEASAWLLDPDRELE